MFSISKRKGKLWIFVMMTVFLCALYIIRGPSMKAYATVYSGTGYGVSWSYDDSSKTLTITGGSMTSASSYSSYPWYSYVSKATKIVCNNSGAIGSYAFQRCYYAATIDIGANVTSIGKSAFYYSGRYQATNVYVRRAGNVTVGTSAFYANYHTEEDSDGYTEYYYHKVTFHCHPVNSGITSLSLKYSSSSYQAYAFDLGSASTWYAWDGIEWNFSGTTGKGTLTVRTKSGADGTADAVSVAASYPWYGLLIKDRVSTITVNCANVGTEAFYNCDAVSTINATTTGAIGTYAFYYGAPTINVNAGGEIGSYAFQNCTDATTITVNATTIGTQAFEKCYYASKIDIGANVTNIGSKAFYYSGRYQNTNVYVRRNGNVTVGSSAFYTNYHTEEDSDGYTEYYYHKVTFHCYPANTGVLSLSLKYSSASYQAYAFDLTNSTSQWYSWDGIEWNFSGTTGKGTLTVRTKSGADGTADAASVNTSFPWYQLLAKDKVSAITVNCANVGTQAFYNCDAVSTINVTTTGAIGTYAFYYGAPTINVNAGGEIGSYAFQNCTDATTITVNATTIGTQAFEKCYYASKIDIGANVTNIGSKAFYYSGHYQSTNVYVRRNGNVTIGSSAFYMNYHAEEDSDGYTEYYYHKVTFYLWSANTNLTNYTGLKYKSSTYMAKIYFDSVGTGCSHPSISVSGWKTSGTTHYKQCSHCTAWTTSHTASWSWVTTDATNHWQKCGTCGLTQNKAAHSYGSYYNNTATCTAAGTKQKKCGTCSKVVTETAAALGHVTPSSYTDGGDGYQYKYCTRCNAQLAKVANTYTVVYNANGGSGTMASTTHTYGTALALTKNAFTAPTGYHFGRWTTNANGSGNSYTDGQSVSNLTKTNKATINLYAQWNPNTFTVKFNANGGTGTMADQGFSYKVTEALTANAFTRTNYEFIGWSTSNTATTASYANKADGSTLTTTNGGTVTLYAVWKLSTTDITFDDNGGSGGPGSVTWLIDSVQYPATPVKEGYAFDGWNTKADGSGSWWPSNNKTPANISAYYAQWTPVSYYVMFQKNTGRAADSPAHVSAMLQTGPELNAAFKDLAGSLDRIEYVKRVGAMPKSGTVVISTSDPGVELTNPLSDCEVYAAFAGDSILIYSEADEIMLNPDSSGTLAGMTNLTGAGAFENFNTYHATDISCFFYNNTSVTALNLSCWNTPNVTAVSELFYGCSSLTEILASSRFKTSGVGDYADGTDVFTGCTSLSGYDSGKTDVTYANTDTGYLTLADNYYFNSIRQALSYDKEEALEANTYTKTGYLFKGWSTTADGDVSYTEAQTVKNLSTEADDVIPLYAVWESSAYEISFHKNDEKAEGSMINQGFRYDVTQNLNTNTFTKTGYYFTEWNTKPDYTGTSYADGANILNLTDLDDSVIPFYAKWTPNPYKVHFNKNFDKASGTMADQAFVYDTAQALNKNAFMRTGYTFDNWNSKADLSGTVYQDMEEVLNLTTEKDGIVDLFVNWLPNTYTVKFDANGGNGSMDAMAFTYDASQRLTANTFTREGYTFQTWNTEPDGSGDSYGDNTSVSNLTAEKDGIVTLYAQWRPHSYILQFSGNTSTSGSMENQLVKYGDQVNIAKNLFEKTGYTFTGWIAIIDNSQVAFTDEQLIENLTPVDGTIITMRAQWEANSYLVEFNKNFDNAKGSMERLAVDYDSTVTLTPNGFTNTGYLFDSWNTKADGSGTRYENGARITNLASGNGDVVTLYAQWTPVTYTVTFDANTGTGSMESITMTYDTKTKLPDTTFTKTGYPFSAWNTKADGTGTSFMDGAEVVNLASTQDASVTLYAQWDAAVYDVIFHKNADDAEGSMDRQPLTYDVAQQLVKNSFTKTGYSFAKWNDAADGSGKSYMDQATVMNLSSEDGAEVNLYAQWTANLYTVEFDKNDTEAAGSMTAQQFTFDEAQFLKANAFTKTGYTFAGWNTVPDGSGTTYTNKQTVKNLLTEANGSMTLYAQWTPNHYNVAFDKNASDAEGSMLAQPFDYDKAQILTANAFTRTGYDFAGWCENADGSGTVYADRESVKNLTTDPYGIVTLYAQWEPHTYYVKFNPNNEAYTGSSTRQTFRYGIPQRLDPAFELDGYLFNGWNTSPDGSGISYFDMEEVVNLTSTDKAVVNLYAQWLAGAYYVAFDGNGADSGEMGKQGMVYDTENILSKNRFTKNGYHFTNWSTNADGTGSVYNDEEPVVNVTDGDIITLYAQWAPNSYHVAYNKNAQAASGTMEDDILSYGTDAVLSTNAFTRTGYTFMGWNTVPDGSGTSYKDNETVKNLTAEQDGMVTLYAQWEANAYQIVYDKNSSLAAGSTLTTKTSYNETVLIPECGFVRAGYSSYEWNTKADGTGDAYRPGMEVMNLTSEPDGKVTLYAQWTPNSYYLVFDKNSTKASGDMDPQTFVYDTEAAITANQFRYTGYTFTGWNTEADGSGTSYRDQETVKNLLSGQDKSLTLYAQWTPVTYTMRFHSNHGAGEIKEQTLTYDMESALSVNTFTKEGYMFLNWSTAADGSGDVYMDGSTVKNLTAKDGTVIDLYAQWGTIKYHVAFEKNADTVTGTMTTATFGYDQSQRLPANGYVRAGYTFTGWNREPDGTGVGYADQAVVLNLTSEADATVTLYAQWEQNRYSITFDKNADQASGTMADQVIAYDDTVALTANGYVRSGYVFDSWNRKADGSGTRYADGQEIKNLAVNEGTNIVLYAQWTPVTYFVSFNSGAFNASGTMDRQEIVYDVETALFANLFSRTGYLFNGWSLSSDGSGEKYADAAKVLNLCDEQDEEIILYATWDKSSYYIDFYGNGADSGAMTRQTVVYGDRTDLTSNTFIRNGYEFVEWNTEADGSGTSYSDEEELYNEVDAAHAVINLYAQWNPTACTVTYELNGGAWAPGYTAPTQKQYDESLRLPLSANLSNEGFMFLGWYTNASCTGTAVTELPAESGNVTVYARWYDLSGRSSGLSQTITHDFSTQ